MNCTSMFYRRSRGRCTMTSAGWISASGKQICLSKCSCNRLREYFVFGIIRQNLVLTRFTYFKLLPRVYIHDYMSILHLVLNLFIQTYQTHETKLSKQLLQTCIAVICLKLMRSKHVFRRFLIATLTQIPRLQW